jgi:3',5'-nucleoside bisphosphate phosphatase
LIILRAELHVHTVLSPCADVEMIPPLIVEEALSRGIGLLAITDHNNTLNIEAVMKAAAGTSLVVLPGMELQTREEVHSLCLFETLQTAQEFGRWVDTKLPDMRNDPDHFGEQFIVDDTGDFIRREERLMLVSASCSLNEAFTRVNGLGGLFIPAHINRTAFGLIPMLGLVPDDITIEALEISRQITPEAACKKYPQIKSYPLLQGGDAHRLEELLGLNEFTVASPSLSEIKLALKGKTGRSIRIISG